MIQDVLDNIVAILILEIIHEDIKDNHPFHFQSNCIFINKMCLDERLCVVVHLFQHNVFLLLKKYNDDKMSDNLSSDNLKDGQKPGCNAPESVG